MFLFSVLLGVASAAPELRQETVDFLKPKLNSDRIEYFFGNYGVDKLDMAPPTFPESRIANLHSVHQGQKMMRTLAIVDFYQPVHDELYSAHWEIKEGKSIGAVLREHGWAIRKKPVYFGVIPLSAGLMDWMGECCTDRAALHIYCLEVSKNHFLDSISYCTIIEVHSPQYLSDEWLQALYDDQYHEFSTVTEEIEELLFNLLIMIQEFPFNPESSICFGISK